MRLLICGDRNWVNYDTVMSVLRRISDNVIVECVIEGEARGADSMGRLAAENLGIPIKPFEADWEAHGRAAGPIRNEEMLRKGKPDAVVAFHTNIDESRGTKHMVSIAAKANLPVWVYQEGVLALAQFIIKLKGIENARTQRTT